VVAAVGAWIGFLGGCGVVPGTEAEPVRCLAGAPVRRGGEVTAAGCSAPSRDKAAAAARF